MIKFVKGLLSPFNITKVWLTVILTMSGFLYYYYSQAKIANSNVAEYRLQLKQVNDQLVYAINTGNSNAEKLINERARNLAMLDRLLSMQNELDLIKDNYIEIEKEVVRYVEASDYEVKSCFNTTLPNAILDRLR